MKRIEIATVMARGTKLSVFDEPEAGIDLWSFQNLIQVFEKMHKEKKRLYFDYFPSGTYFKYPQMKFL